MKSVAVTLAASLGILIGGCAGEMPVQSAAVPVVPGESDGAKEAGDGVSSAPAVLAAVADNGDASGRDAKEAAEEAARRIFDATVGAAARIKEAGIGAVQAVRETTARKNGDPADVTEAENPGIFVDGSDKADSTRN